MTKDLETRLKNTIDTYSDFPKPGIAFKDIMPVLRNPELLADTIDALAELFTDNTVDVVAGPESRGFLFGVLLAQKLGVPFVAIRKPGKLPGEIVSRRYDLEYGHDEVQIQANAVKRGDRIAIVDDLLATGGTAAASVALFESVGATVRAMAFVVELPGLHGRDMLDGQIVHSLIQYS